MTEEKVTVLCTAFIVIGIVACVLISFGSGVLKTRYYATNGYQQKVVTTTTGNTYRSTIWVKDPNVK